MAPFRRRYGKFALAACLSLSTVLLGPKAQSKPACDELAGAVVFKDMLYGLGGGVLLTGLYLAASNDSENLDQRLSVGGLVGTTLGMGAGLLELGMRDCSTEIRLQGSQTKTPIVTVAAHEGKPAVVLGYSMSLGESLQPRHAKPR